MGLYLRNELKFFHSFIDLGLQFDLRENESYRNFIAKDGIFFARKSPMTPQIFYKLEMCHKMLFSSTVLLFETEFSTNLYVLVVTLSVNDNIKQGFKETVSRDKYRS